MLRFIVLFVAGIAGVLRADDLASRVVILANGDEPESVRLAEYYAEKRGVPTGNIIALPLPRSETINRRTFVDALYEPLKEELVKREWIDAVGMDHKDALGRRRWVESGHKISYLVVCRGVPLKISHDANLPAEKSLAPDQKEFKTNAAAVDAELALIATTTPFVGFVPNPFFRNDAPSSFQREKIVKVGRLDGPSYDDALRLIDGALEAERTGLIGRAYIDIGGPHARGDEWLNDVAKQIAELDFDHDADRGRGSLSAWARMDAPALYFGWYASSVNGPFQRDDFSFPAGAVALHIHSASATTLRSRSRGWAGPLVARGVAATFGNVYEPYLELTHQPHLVLKALARGDTLGDAAAYSIPAYSWQGIVVGDPLYRPFKVSLETQWERRAQLSSESRAYVVLRRMRELDRAGRRNEAIWAGLESQKQEPHLAVAWLTADLQFAAGDKGGVRQTLAAAAERGRFNPEEIPLAVLIARRLREAGDAGNSLAMWRVILNERDLAEKARQQWLRVAAETARDAKDTRQAQRWDEEHKTLSASIAAAEAEAKAKKAAEKAAADAKKKEAKK